MESAPSQHHDLIELIAHRGHILRHLESEPKSKPELVETVTVSRSTIDRAVRELETQELVAREAGTVSLTTRGGLVLDLYRFITDVIDGIDTLDTELADIPIDRRPNYAMFSDATIITGTGAAPHHPVSVFQEELGAADQVRAISMTVIPSLVEEFQNRIRNSDLDVEMVVSEEVLSRLVASHPDALELSVDHDQVRLYQTGASLPYGLSILDGATGQSAIVHLYGDGGITAIVQSGAPAAVAWAERVLEDHRSTATPV